MHNASRDRALYDKVVKMAPKGVVPTMGNLRQELKLVNNNGSYVFDFNEQKNAARPTEQLLSLKDSFVANIIKLGLVVERKTKPGSGVVMTFAEEGVAGMAGAIASDLECIWNGYLKAQIDTQVMMDKLSTSRFRHVPDVSALMLGQAAQQTPLTPWSPERGALHLEPNFILSGTKRNEFTLNVPTYQVAGALAAVDPAWEVRAVLQLEGYIIPGGARLAVNQ